MTSRRLALLALLIVVPLTLGAQGRRGSGSGPGTGAGTGGGGGPKRDMPGTARIAGGEQPPSLSQELEWANPIDALIGARKKLRLSADEERELKIINKRLKDSIKPFLKNPTQASVDSVGAKYRAATDEALAKLTEEHRQAAKDLLQKKG